MKFQRLWFIASLLIVIVLVTSCAAPATQPAAPAAQTTTDSAAPQELSGELTFWSGYPEMAPLYDKVIADFQAQHPKVKVTYLTHPLRDYEQKLAAAIPTDTGPDIFEGSLYANLRFIEADLIPEVPAEVLAKFPNAWDQSIIDYNLYNGKRYSVPFFEGRSAFFVNTDCLAEAGLPVPPQDKPISWDEFVNMAQKMAKVDASGKVERAGLSLRLSGGSSGVAEKYWVQGMPFGLQLLVPTADGKWKSGINSEASFKTLKFYIDSLYNQKVDSHELKHDAEGFELGQACMFQRETWVVGDIAKKAPDLKYTTMPLPKADGWNYLRNSFGLYVTRTTKNPELAWAFVEALVAAEAQQYMIEATGWLPSRSDVDYSAILEKTPAFKSFLVKDPAYTPMYTPKLGVFNEIWTKFAERMIKAYLDPSLVNNDAAIQKLLDDASAEANEILDREGLLGQ